MLLHEGVESLLAAADGYDLAALLDELVGHGGANAGRRADEENSLVLERHVCDLSGFVGHGMFLDFFLGLLAKITSRGLAYLWTGCFTAAQACRWMMNGSRRYTVIELLRLDSSPVYRKVHQTTSHRFHLAVNRLDDARCSLDLDVALETLQGPLRHMRLAFRTWSSVVCMLRREHQGREPGFRHRNGGSTEIVKASQVIGHRKHTDMPQPRR